MKSQVLIPETVLYTLLFIFIIMASYNILTYLTNSFNKIMLYENNIKYFYTLEKTQDVLLKNATHVVIRLEYPTLSNYISTCSKIVLDNGTITIFTK